VGDRRRSSCPHVRQDDGVESKLKLKLGLGLGLRLGLGLGLGLGLEQPGT